MVFPEGETPVYKSEFAELERSFTTLEIPSIRRVLQSFLQSAGARNLYALELIVLWYRCLSGSGREGATDACRVILEPLSSALLERARFKESDAEDKRWSMALLHHLMSVELHRSLETLDQGQDAEFWLDLVVQVDCSSDYDEHLWFLLCVDVHLYYMQSEQYELARASREALRRIADRLGDASLQSQGLLAEAGFLTIGRRRNLAWGKEEEVSLSRIKCLFDRCNEADTAVYMKGMSCKVLGSVDLGEELAAIADWQDLASQVHLITGDPKTLYWIFVAGHEVCSMCSAIGIWKEALLAMRLMRRLRKEYSLCSDACGELYLKALGEIWDMAKRMGRGIILDEMIYEVGREAGLGRQTRSAFLDLMHKMRAG